MYILLIGAGLVYLKWKAGRGMSWRVTLYPFAAVWVLIRHMAAFPLVLVAIGADAMGDTDMFDRLSERIDRIAGRT